VKQAIGVAAFGLSLLLEGAFAATLVVDSTSDLAPAGDSVPGDGLCEDLRSGTRCTLRAAIEEANALPGFDTIAFSVAGSIVIVDGALPVVTDSIAIDGRTAPDYVSNGTLAGSPPRITIDGALQPASSSGLRLRGADATTSDLLALSIVNFGGNAIQTSNDADDLLVQGCYIGLRPDGSAAGNGIGLNLVSNDHSIGQFGPPGSGTGLGNVISANDGLGILVAGSNSRIRANLIGTAQTGSGDRGNGNHGIQILGGSHLIGDNRADGSGANTITFNAGDGIRINGSDNLVLGNRIGMAGISSLGNDGHGVALFGDRNRVGDATPAGRNLIHGHGLANVLVGSDAVDADDNRIENNSLRSSAGAGLAVSNGARNLVLGNLVGDNASHGIRVNFGAVDSSIAGNEIGFVRGSGGNVFASANAGDGILVFGEGTLVGLDASGPSPVARGNLIGFNAGQGISIQSARSNVQANFIGYTPQLAPMPNAGNGITIPGGATQAFLANNYIGLNAGYGVSISANDARLCNNYIGTNVGFADLGNGGDGILLGGLANRVGGGCSGNVIGFNPVGIRITGDLNLVVDNWIGVSPFGDDIGNSGAGILLTSGASENRINLNDIGYNWDGIEAAAGAGQRNTFDRNRFRGHPGLGIDLGADGVSPNDPGDADAGPNRTQNHPVIEFANLVAGEVQVTHRTDAQALFSAYPLSIDFHLADASPSPQGRSFLGRVTYATPLVLQVDVLPLPEGTLGGELVALATDAEGNTSEFSSRLAFGVPGALFRNGFELP
jgi:hypothetical protein